MNDRSRSEKTLSSGANIEDSALYGIPLGVSQDLSVQLKESEKKMTVHVGESFVQVSVGENDKKDGFLLCNYFGNLVWVPKGNIIKK